MSVLSDISSVAKYESKLLMRSWFYRIFLVLAVLVLCIFNFLYLAFPDNIGYWIMRALPSNIPYINLLLLNTGQAVIAVFLSSEFLKADKKLDTSEVFYVHPLSNAEYVIGKIWGNLNVFLRLNLIIIGLVVVFNMVSGLPIDWTAYLIYFLVISVPTLIYIFGLSIGLMLILKNQAITFVLLLGYIALTLFYIADKFYYLFDYMVYSLPLVKSSIVGFTNWSSLINHRLIYLLIGLGFICISIFLFRRLPNTKYGRYRWLALAFCFILAGFVAGYKHVNTFLHASNMRAMYTEINNKYVNTPQMVIENYEISVEQYPASISAEVVMHGTAYESSSVFTFCLNPFLVVSEVKENGKNLSFTRDQQIILIDFGRVLAQGDTATWTITYDGRVDENFCYLDIPADLLQEKYTVEGMFNVDKKYSFQTENYVLFTPETYWYPRPGVAYSSENPDWQRAYFSNYRLTVKPINGLTAISQGTRLEPREKAPTIRSNEYDSNDGMVRRPNSGGGGGGMFFRGGGMGGAMGAIGGGARPQGQVVVSATGVPRGGGQGGGPGGGPGGQGANFRPQGQGGPGQTPQQGGQAQRPQQGQGAQGQAPQQGQGVQDDANGRPQQGQGGDFRAQGPEGDDIRASMRDSIMRMREEGGDFRAQGPEGDEFRARMREDGGGTRPQGPPPADDEFRARMSEGGDSIFVFQTDFPTPAISLIIGDYEQKNVEVDRTIYSIWHLKGNDYFSSAFEAVADTLPYQIRVRRQAFESNYSLNYSFRRFSVVEVPVQFSSYVRTWTQAQEKLQPEMVLFPEKGSTFNNLDITRSIAQQKSFGRRMRREISDNDAAVSVFNNFIMTFQQAESRGNISMDRGSLNITNVPNPYFLFPQLYNFRYNIFSSDWTIANRLIELYLQNKEDNNRMRQMNGISNNEKANLLIQQHPFKELLNDPKQRDLLDNIISLKANVLFAPAELSVGFMEFRDSLRAYLHDKRFTNIRFEDLLDDMSMIAGEDLHAAVATWDSPAKLPAYIVGVPEIINIINRDVEVYVVRLQITNNSDYDGIVDVETVFGGNSSAAEDPRAKRKVSLVARETKQLVTVWDEAPRSINVNTLISANLPNLISMPANNIAREQNIPIDKEGDFILANVSYNLSGEVIVDNEDVGLFVLSQPDIVGLLPQWLEQVGDNTFPYQGVQGFRPPLQWTLTTGETYYGTHIRSAYVIKSGSGSQTATWKIPVPSKGLYDLYYYVNQPDELRRGGNNRGGFGGGGGSRSMEYHLKVHYDGDADDAYINLRRAREGWSRVGTYNFSDDTIKVVLSNDIANIRIVTADAVKIVKRETSNDRNMTDENMEFARVE